MKLSTYQLYVRLVDDKPVKSSGKPFFKKSKKFIPPTYYCPKCNQALLPNGKCQNDLECK